MERNSSERNIVYTFLKLCDGDEDEKRWNEFEKDIYWNKQTYNKGCILHVQDLRRYYSC